MISLRKRDRAKRVKPKLKKSAVVSFISVGLVFVMCFGLLASAASSLGNSPVLNAPVLDPPEISPPGSNDTGSSGEPSNPDNPGTELDAQAVQVLQMLEFEDSYSWEPGNVAKLYDGADLISRMNYGSYNVSDGYLEFTSRAQDIGTTSSTKFGLFLNSDSNIYEHQLVSADSCDYLIVDFDVWSDTGLMPNVRFDFTVLGKYSETYEDMFFLKPEILYESEEQHFALRTYIEEYPGGTTLMYRVIDDITQKQHITCWFDMSDFSVNFLNGNLTFPASSDVNLGSLLEFTFDIYEHEVAENESLCIDNFCVSTYGNGSGEYNGDISKAYDSWVNNPEDKDKWLSIYDCTDWVLYDQYINGERLVAQLSKQEL